MNGSRTWWPVLLSALVFSGLSTAQVMDENQSKTTTPTTAGEGQSNLPVSRFSAYKPNYLFYSRSEDDDETLQVRLSAKYTFFECGNSQGNSLARYLCMPFSEGSLLNGFGDLNIFFSYTTDFDFYVFSDGDGELRRESEPVRNRMTSPGLHFDWKRDAPADGSNFWWANTSVSLIHHSNGQDLEFETFFDETSTADEIHNVISDLENNQPSWMDGVSRGWNYLEIKGIFHMGDGTRSCDGNFSCATLYADVKVPITKINDDIWWEPGNTSRFQDYNIVEMTLSNEWGRNINSGEGMLSAGKKEFSLQLQCGNKGCSSSSWIRFDTYFGEGSFRLPLMIYAHLGRNEHFYNYHERTNTVGLGFQFNP